MSQCINKTRRQVERKLRLYVLYNITEDSQKYTHWSLELVTFGKTKVLRDILNNILNKSLIYVMFMK